MRGEAEFLFGGWSWKNRCFGIWRLYYEPTLSAFTHGSLNSNDTRVVVFIGDHVESAEELLENKLREADKLLVGAFDMEPLQVLAQMARDPDDYRPIGGALQIAKIYQSGTSEFFGVMWPSISGQPTFLGRQVPTHELPAARLFDPDLGLILEDPLPEILVEIEEALYGPEIEFLQECYPNSRLKTNLSEKERKKLKKLIQTASYKKYCDNQLMMQESADE